MSFDKPSLQRMVAEWNKKEDQSWEEFRATQLDRLRALNAVSGRVATLERVVN